MNSELNVSEMIRSARSTLTKTYPPRHQPDPNFFSEEFASGPEHGGYDCMQPITTAAVAAAILLIAGCSSHPGAPIADTPTAKPAATITTRSSTIAPSSPEPARPTPPSTTPPSTTTSTTPPSTTIADPVAPASTIGDDPVRAFDEQFQPTPGPEEAAVALIDALQHGDTASLHRRVHDSYQTGIAIWAQALGAATGGRTIDARVLTVAGDRATVAVDVSFPPAVDGTITDPVAYIVELLDTPAGWLVTSMGFA